MASGRHPAPQPGACTLTLVTPRLGPDFCYTVKGELELGKLFAPGCESLVPFTAILTRHEVSGLLPPPPAPTNRLNPGVSSSAGAKVAVNVLPPRICRCHHHAALSRGEETCTTGGYGSSHEHFAPTCCDTLMARAGGVRHLGRSRARTLSYPHQEYVIASKQRCPWNILKLL